MNPWAFVVILIAIGFFILAYNGKQDNLIAAVLGRKYGNSTLQ